MGGKKWCRTRTVASSSPALYCRPALQVRQTKYTPGLQTADARDFAEHPDLQHRCEQFTCSEAEELCTQLAGLPLCFEHGDGADSRPALIVGSVNRAWVGPNREVQIEALVRASTGLEKTVRDGILSKNLSGLSLSAIYLSGR